MNNNPEIYDCEKPICVSRIKALEAENAKLRAVAEAARHIRCNSGFNCGPEGIEELRNALRKLEAV